MIDFAPDLELTFYSLRGSQVSEHNHVPNEAHFEPFIFLVFIPQDTQLHCNFLKRV